MIKDLLLRRIEAVLDNADLIVLKGFSPNTILRLEDHFIILDKYIFEDNYINLDQVNYIKFLQDILCLKGRAVCSVESFILFCNCVNGLDIIPKKIGVLVNNLMDMYPNPSSARIPDFDSSNFTDCTSETLRYSAFYSLCIHEHSREYIQYIDNYSIGNNNLQIEYLINPIDVPITNGKSSTIYLSYNKLKGILRNINDTFQLDPCDYRIDREYLNAPMVKIFAGAVRELQLPIRFFLNDRTQKVQIRAELFKTLKDTWGYDNFRNINVYKDLLVSREVIEVSQGEIIKTVIRQAEIAKSQNNSETFNNILLTAPTGAGKSLLFQLSAIYLARKYKYVTIVVSPLVALMEDQVDALIAKYNGVASLNSTKTATEKERVLNGILTGEINILYLSPELLLSYRISTFIGNRQLGLLVVDEAHTVTTWGRDFRVDYWFLGDYIRAAKRELGYLFPIFALTATAVWDISKKNDMIGDTIESLYMSPCIKFIGDVRRSNIKFDIQQSNISNKYEELRLKLTIKRIREALQQDRKTIVYCPYRSTVNQLRKEIDQMQDISDKIAIYHAGIKDDEKKIYARDFKDGTRPVICATKAFGMGIDVSDIKEVYHHAPTGCLSDYIQEIGRLARDPHITGIAKIDFSENDFRYIRRLYGLSTIKPYQLHEVLRKLVALYRLNGEKRNMLISADEFSYIFPNSDGRELDGNVKSSLLLLSNDLKNKLNFEAIIVRPKSMFVICYISVPTNQSKQFESLYKEFLIKIKNGVYSFKADKFWYEESSTISFPQFKRKLYTGELFKSFDVTAVNKVKIELSSPIEDIRKGFHEFFDISNRFLDTMARNGKRLKFNEITSQLPAGYTIKDKERFIEAFRLIYELGGRLGNSNKYVRVYSDHANESNAFQLISHGYEYQSLQYINAFNKCICDNRSEYFCSQTDPLLAVCELLSSLGLADYESTGGESPSIFIRINNPQYLSSLARNYHYKNDILDGIYEKQRYSERVFSYFFTTPMNDEKRWDFIESYFLGEDEENLLNFV